MIDIRVEFPAAAQRRLLAALDPKAMRFAEAQALNRTRNNVQAAGLRAISRAMGIKVSELRKRGRLKDRGIQAAGRRAGKFGAVAKGRNATRRRLETAVIGRGRPFNAGRWDGKPVRVANRVVATEHAAYGRRQIAKRTWQLKSNKAIVKPWGASFRGVYGPGVGQMMERRDVLRKMEQEALERFPGHFRSAVEFAFSARAPAFLRR